MNDYIEKALHFRNLAEEARMNAARPKIPQAKELFVKLASNYDSLADTLEHIAKIMISNETGAERGR